MTSTTWHRATLTLFALAALLVGGCASDSTLVDPTKATLQIQVVPREIAAPWTLVVPGQPTRTGNGDATLPMMPFGTYTITWGAADGWVPPAPNVVRGVHESASHLIFTGIYTKANATKGTIVVDPNPDTIEVPWSLSGPDGYASSGFGDATLGGLEAGEYVLTWGEILGYVTPEVETALLAEGQTVTFSQTYFLRDLPTGDLVVDVHPDGIGASWQIAGNLDFRVTGTGDTTFVDVPIGQYILTWQPVEGWTSPTPNPLTTSVPTDGSATLRGVYTAITVATGTVVVDPGPNGLSAPWTLEGPDRFTAQGNGDQQLTGRAVGTYTLTWGQVAGYHTPPAQSGTLDAEGTLTFASTYARQTGSIAIDAEPNALSAPWSLTGPEGTTTGTGDRVLDAMPVGTYTLTWGAVAGWNTPYPVTRVVTLGSEQSLTIAGTYEEIPPELGTVVVDPRPAGIGASWRLVGPAGLDRTGSTFATFSDLPVGSYTITWNAIPDWRTPVPAQVTQSLSDGQTIAFVGVYGQLSGPSIQPVSGTLTNGTSLTIRGSGFGTHTMEISNGVGVNGWIEKNATGTDIDNVSGVSGWSRVEASAPVVISTERAYAGSKSLLGRVDIAGGTSWQAGPRYRHAQTFDRIYASFWIYWDPINLSPYRNTQWKLWRINHNGTVSDQAGQIYFSSRHNSDGSLYDHQWVVHCALGCSGTNYDDCYREALPIPYYAPRFGDKYQYRFLNKGDSRPWTDAHPQRRQWNRVEIYVDRGVIDTYSGVFQYSILRPGQGKVFEELVTQLKLWSSQTDCRNPQDPWQYFQMQNYWDDDGSFNTTPFTQERADFFFDDIYLQFGTQARVELGDAASYDNCTRLEIQPPAAWSDGSITVNVNRGGFASGSALYLFVVREDGTVSTGVPVTVQ